MDNTEKILQAFWLAMTDIYGKRWIEEHGEEPGLMWRGALKEISPERIKAAIYICRDAGDQYAITLSTFMKRVRSIKLNTQQKALPKKPTKNISEVTKEKFSRFTSDRKQSPKKIRSVILSGESWMDYKSAMASAVVQGKTIFQFKWSRLNQNGWTIDDERALYNATRACHYPIYTGTTNLLNDLNE